MIYNSKNAKKPGVIKIRRSEIRTASLLHGKRPFYPLDKPDTAQESANLSHNNDMLYGGHYSCCLAAARCDLLDMPKLVFAHAHLAFGGVGRIPMQLLFAHHLK
jgi:hypothetical protein